MQAHAQSQALRTGMHPTFEGGSHGSLAMPHRAISNIMAAATPCLSASLTVLCDRIMPWVNVMGLTDSLGPGGVFRSPEVPICMSEGVDRPDAMRILDDTMVWKEP